MVGESASTLSREGVHPTLVHEKWMGLWKVASIITLGLGCLVLNGRQIRARRASVSHMKPFHARPADISHDFED